MVLGLAEAGDLQRALDLSDSKGIDELRVQFYAAEIILALNHLHTMGLMYRDLKPNNVILCENGHILLADLGGVVDQTGRVLSNQQLDSASIDMPLFTRKYGHGIIPTLEEKEVEPDEGQPKRRLSIMGTVGYMAPEMVIIMRQPSHEKVGYTKAVDYWSLGVTLFKLLTGSKPFSDKNLNGFIGTIFPFYLYISLSFSFPFFSHAFYLSLYQLSILSI